MQIQYVGHERKAKCPTFFMPNFFWNTSGRSAFCIILVSALGYSWNIRRVFVGYSWGIRMYRVCVGNVSGMYRESVEADWEVSGGDGYRMQID